MVNISLCYTYMEDQSTFREFVVAIIIGQLLQNICITDDHGYVPFVMTTIPSFYLVPHLSTNINEC
jgi:uncharacterized membrane protein YcaP (DUF421 family)